MIHVTIIPDALSRGRNVVEVHHREGLKVTHVIEDIGGRPDDGEKWLAIRGGARCSLDEVLGIDDDLVLARFPAGISLIVFIVHIRCGASSTQSHVQKSSKFQCVSSVSSACLSVLPACIERSKRLVYVS